MANEYGLSYGDGAEKAIIKLIGCCIPHHIQMFFDHSKTYCIRKKITQLNKKDILDIYKTEMLSTRGHAELTHYEERLKMVLGSNKMALALDMLTEAAVNVYLTKEAIIKLQQEYDFENEDVKEIQKEILWILEHDGYLTNSPSGYKFVSNLLRNWWKNRYQMFFTSILERKA